MPSEMDGHTYTAKFEALGGIGGQMSEIRPCIEFHAQLEVCHTGGWIASFGDKFWVSGDTPERAMENFDKRWTTKFAELHAEKSA